MCFSVNLKRGDQCKNYKVTTCQLTCIRGFDRVTETKILNLQFEILVDLQRVLSFFIENDWLKFFYKITTDVIEKLRGQI